MKKAYTDQQFAHAQTIARVIGDYNNVLILYELVNFGEKSFNELKRMTNCNAVTLSKKLTNLRIHGIVDSKKIGNEVHYFITEKSRIYHPLIKDIENIVINTKE